MHHQQARRAIIVLSIALLVSCGAPERTGAAVIETGAERCDGLGDVFQLSAPGTYTAMAIDSSGLLPTEVRGMHGEVLATASPTGARDGRADPLAWLRFGRPRPQMFTVESPVMIHVQHKSGPYELTLLRSGDAHGMSDVSVRPPVEHVVNEAGSCLIGESRETFKIDIEAVYSHSGSTQAFLIESPDVSATL